jgi:flagellin
VDFQAEANSGNNVKVKLTDARTTALGIDELTVHPRSTAEDAITKIDSAITKVTEERSKYGAFQNALEHINSNISNAEINLSASESRIRDVDMTKEMMNQTKSSVLAQASQAMLAQANQQLQGLLQLLG